MGLLFGQNDFGDLSARPSIGYRAGIHIGQYLNTGVGLGIDVYDGGGILPVFLDLHGDIGKVSALMPHYVLNAGYGFAFAPAFDTDEFTGGPMGHVGLD